VRAAERPPASERDVHPQAELARSFRGHADPAQELRREVRIVADAARGIVDGQRIDDGDLESADSAFFHLAQVAIDLRFGNRRAEPPPPHHDAAVVGRIRELVVEPRLYLRDAN
jgi:hypothetical protein